MSGKRYDIGKEWCPCLYTGALVFVPTIPFCYPAEKTGRIFPARFSYVQTQVIFYGLL